MPSRQSYSASEALFEAPLRPELDPAQLLDELRSMRPLIDRLARLAPVVDALEGLTPARVQEFRHTMEEHSVMIARLEHAGPQVDRIEELLALLDSLEVLVARQ
jgi:hypothetical protein